MALTQISTQGIKDGTITGTDLATNIDLSDSQKLRLGTGNDLVISQDGSEALIRNTTGDFFIQNSAGDIALAAENHITLKNFDGQTYARFMEDGQCELYHDDSKKLETTADGVNIGNHVFTTGGNYTVGNNITLVDGGKAKFGTGSDLEIYHDGTNTKFDNITGKLLINTSANLFAVLHGSDDAIISRVNGAVELYDNGSKKLETHSGGVSVLGNLSLTDADGYELRLGAGSDLRIFHDGSDSFIDSTKTGGQVLIRTKESGGTTNNCAKFMPTGAVELYFDGSKKFETHTNGVHMSGSMYFPDNQIAGFGDVNNPDLRIYHNGSHSYIKNSTNYTYYLSTQHHFKNVADNQLQAKFAENAGVELYFSGGKKFETTSTGVTVTGDLVPEANDTRALGTGSLQWAQSNIRELKVYEQSIHYDNVKATFGHGNDLQIYYDGSNSIINDAGTGTLRIQTDGANQWEFNGAIFKGNDNRKITLGNSSDLEIYHDGHNFIHADNGDLNICIESGSKVVIQEGTSGSHLAEFNFNGGVELFYDGSPRLNTASAGLEFHNLTAGSGNSDLRYNSSTGAVFFDTSTILVKTNIENVPYGLDTLNKLQPRIYERTDCNNEVELGFIAEEVDKLIPEIVPKIEGKPVNVDYRKISVVLTKAVQELAAKVAVLEAS